jgi:predicted Zn finger-like uncharacterized protein
MTHLRSALATVPAPLADAGTHSGTAVCPLCHTPSAITADAVAAGEGWRCERCGQRWDGASLTGAAAYAAWAAGPRRASA